MGVEEEQRQRQQQQGGRVVQEEEQKRRRKSDGQEGPGEGGEQRPLSPRGRGRRVAADQGRTSMANSNVVASAVIIAVAV